MNRALVQRGMLYFSGRSANAIEYHEWYVRETLIDAIYHSWEACRQDTEQLHTQLDRSSYRSDSPATQVMRINSGGTTAALKS